MATEVKGSGLTRSEGQTQALSTTALCVAVKPGFDGIELYCSDTVRYSQGPKLVQALYYTGSSGVYTDVTTLATDRTGPVTLNSMATADALCLCLSDPTRGIYYDVTNTNGNAATQVITYTYDVAEADYIKITGTLSGTFTVGETVTSTFDGVFAALPSATGTVVYDGSTYLVVKASAGNRWFTETALDAMATEHGGVSDQTITGSTSGETVTAVTAVAQATIGTNYWTSLSGTDGTIAVAGKTLGQDGLVTWTTPTDWVASKLDGSYQHGYWVKWSPSGALDSSVTVVGIIPAAYGTAYAYLIGGLSRNQRFNRAHVGGYELIALSGTPTAYINWERD